jgi:hypothetical protein
MIPSRKMGYKEVQKKSVGAELASLLPDDGIPFTGRNTCSASTSPYSVSSSYLLLTVTMAP